MVIRRAFPQIYEIEHPKTGRYWLVAARRPKWGLNERKIFSTKKLAEEHADGIEENLRKFGAQTDVPKEKIVLAESYQVLKERFTRNPSVGEPVVVA